MAVLKEGNNHICVFGVTRSGKSYFCKKAIKELSCGAIFFNIQGEKKDFGKMITCRTSQNDINDIIQYVLNGHKINLVFDDTRQGYDRTAGYILEQLMSAGFDENNYIYIVIDECHLLKGYGKEMAEYCSTSGLKNGIRLILVSQRPALVSKTLYTQAFEQYLFQIPKSEMAYFKNKGIPYDECLKIWGEPYSRKYVYYNDWELVECPPI